MGKTVESSSASSVGTAGGTGDRVFLRKASGLIKTAGATDVFIFNVGLVSIGIGLGTAILYGPAVYPGGSLILGIIIASVAMALVALGMITWTVTIPRSGGVYAFGSRILPPSLAFASSFTESICWLFLTGVAAYWIVTIGIVPMFTMAAVITGNSTLQSIADTLSHEWAIFLVGTLVLLLAGGILTSGMRRFFLSQKIVFTIAMIGSLLLVAILLFGSRADFTANFNNYFGPDATYDGVIQTAKDGGWANPGFSWKQTLLASNWWFLPLIGAAFSIAIGGEIKSVTKSQTWGMLGAIVLCAVVWLISVPLAYKVFGYDFLGAVGFNDLNGLAGTPTTPWITLLAGVLTDSWVVTVLVSMGFIAWIWMWVPGMQAYGERAMIAWAFDRIAPGRLGQVSDRTHSPVVAIAAATGLTVAFLALFVFTTYFITLIIFIELALLAWMFVLAAGIVFPYRRPEMYEKSPISNKKMFGLPIMTVACSAGFLAALFYFFVLFFDSFAAGHDPKRLTIMGVTFVGGIVLFYVARQIRKSQGVNIDLAFKEIPIE
ncbi:MAG: APC family permease [Actinobacteria bacterium]|nr:APC family permease [Actinomycetota bacterium]